MTNPAIISQNTWRKANALDLFKLHPDHAAIKSVLAASTPLHTLLALYPFDIEEYAPEVIRRLTEREVDFNLFSNNMLNLHEGWGMETKAFSDRMLNIESEARAWEARRGSFVALCELFERRISAQQTTVSPTRGPKSTRVKAEDLVSAIYYALAYAAYGSIELDLHMSSRLKDMVSHTLIYLTQPEIYNRWGSKHYGR